MMRRTGRRIEASRRTLHLRRLTARACLPCDAFVTCLHSCLQSVCYPPLCSVVRHVSLNCSASSPVMVPPVSPARTPGAPRSGLPATPVACAATNGNSSRSTGLAGWSACGRLDSDDCAHPPPLLARLARISHQAACRRQKAHGFHEVDRDVDDRADCGLRWPRPRGSFGPVRARAPSTVVPAMLSVASTRTGPKSSAIITAPGEKCGLAAALRTSPTRTQIISPSIHRPSAPAALKVTNRNSPRSRGLGRVVGIRALALHAVPIHSLVSVPWGIPPADTPMTPRPLDPDQWEIARRALHHLAHGETARQETRVRGSVPYRNTVRSSSRAALGMRRKYLFYWRSGRNATKMRTARFPRRSRRVRGRPSSTARRERPCGTG